MRKVLKYVILTIFVPLVSVFAVAIWLFFGIPSSVIGFLIALLDYAKGDDNWFIDYVDFLKDVFGMPIEIIKEMSSDNL